MDGCRRGVYDRVTASYKETECLNIPSTINPCTAISAALTVMIGFSL